MITRAVAALLVLVLIGPSVAAAACELTCATAHHHGAPAIAESPCHEDGSSDGGGVSAGPATVCHELSELPSAIVDAVTIGLLQAEPASAAVITPANTTSPTVRPPEPRTVLDSRPAHRPLRV